ncbi:hypothetical protein [Clostridium moutaii]
MNSMIEDMGASKIMAVIINMMSIVMPLLIVFILIMIDKNNKE